jgi:hypothetical protein
MLTSSQRSRRRRSTGKKTPRRGIALVFVLIFVTSMAALAMASIFMASNSNLLAKSYDREKDLRFAAEAALEMGKARVNYDPSVLALAPGNIFDTLMLNQDIVGADSGKLRGIKVNVYAGPTGSTSGQDGRFSSIVAEARDPVTKNGFVRRLELTQESFAKFAYWSNSESNSSQPIFFNNGDELWGPVWSNDTIHIGSGKAIFHDQVATVKKVVGASYGTFTKGMKEGQKPIALPTLTALANLKGYAALGGFDFTGKSNSPASSDETKVLDRIEFIAVDINKSGDSTDYNEGFFRRYTAKAGNEANLHGKWPGASPAISSVKLCGDWHYAKDGTGASATYRLQFYPASVHANAWFKTQDSAGYRQQGLTATAANTQANADQAETLRQMLDNPGARCYLAGDPHLVAVDRTNALGYANADINRGGVDSTFTPIGVMGAWLRRSTSTDTVAAIRPWDKDYLFPINRAFNTGAKGVIYEPGSIGLSGVVNGMLTLYAKGSIVLLDDVRYANDPVKGVCQDILGMITDYDVVIADNALNTPPDIDATKTTMYFSLDDTKDFYLHAVLMALNTSFRVENYGTGPTDVNDCDSSQNGRGCIYLSGGIIQKARGAVGTSSGTGYAKRYSYDRCAIVNPPPYFPTTGRFQDNRYLELDPQAFDPKVYFPSITPGP